MPEFSDHDRPTTSPFAGLVPSRLFAATEVDETRRFGARDSVPRRESTGGSKALMATMPVLLVGTLTLTTLGLAPIQHGAKPDQRSRTHSSDPEPAATIDPISTGPSSSSTTADSSVPADSSTTATGELEIASVAPTTYTVRAGDTVSGIAGRYGLSTASVLALNGLGWKSLIFPNQVLKLTSAPATATVSSVTTAAPVTAPPTPTPAHGTYVIQHGDTVTSIGKHFGVTVAAILASNNLTASSIIYTGRTLVIPAAGSAAASPSSVEPTLVGSVTVPLSPSMQANAQIIISVGRALKVPDYGIVVALAAAAQESDLENLAYGDRDSVGLFQQRPSSGWGSVQQLTTPSYAAALFYGGPSNPNKGKTRGLLDIPNWQSMSVTQAAQAVQISAAPNAYAKWEASARSWLAQLS